jgi:hypothetical protein
MPLIGQPQDLPTIVIRLSQFMNDTGFARWTQQEMDDGVNWAIEAAWPNWWTEFTTVAALTYDSGQAYIELDNMAYGIDEIVNLYLTKNYPTLGRRLIYGWHSEADRVWLNETFDAYNGQGVQLHCRIRPQRLLRNIGGTDGAEVAGSDHFTTATGMGTPILPRAGELLAFKFATDPYDNPWRYRLIKEIVDTNELVVHAPLIASATTGAWWNIGKYTDLPLNYLLHGAASYLYTLSARNGSGTDVQENLNFVAYHETQARLYIQKYRKALPVRYRR